MRPHLAFCRPIPLTVGADAAAIFEGRHPWVFRTALASDNVEAPRGPEPMDGQWVTAIGQDGRVLGQAIFHARGGIALRILSRGEETIDAATLRQRYERAWAKRQTLLQETNGLRLLSGESEGLPGVVIDRYSDVLVVQCYASGTETLARHAARWFADKTSANHVLFKPPKKASGEPSVERWWLGAGQALVWVQEGDLKQCVDLGRGQKSGAFLDLRALRRELRHRDLTGKRVLNLFSYTGTLGLAAAMAGATSVVNIDASETALQFGNKHHTTAGCQTTWIEADAFEWLKQPPDPFDVVIVDPPGMTGQKAQVPRTLATYRRLYTAARQWVRPGGTLIACCCTSRISKKQFLAHVGRGLGRRFVPEAFLPQEPDHPIGFPEAAYLKIQIYRKKG